jgi:hypothetical protein
MPKRQRSKNAAAVALGRLGGLARGRTIRTVMSPAKRTMLARHAALARWAQVRAKQEQETEK